MGLEQVGEGEGCRIGDEEVPGQIVQSLESHGEDVGFYPERREDPGWVSDRGEM